MDLHRATRENLVATIAGAPDEVIVGSIDNGLTWPITCSRIDTTHVQFLVAGPDADPDGATVLPLGSTPLFLRANDDPQAPVRPADIINVY